MKIKVFELPVFMRVGVYAEESHDPQKLLISVEIKLLEKLSPGLSDDLNKSVDYGELIALIDSTLKQEPGQHSRLIETVCQRVGIAVLSEFAAVQSANVKVEKVKIPDKIARGQRIWVEREFTRQVHD